MLECKPILGARKVDRGRIDVPDAVIGKPALIERHASLRQRQDARTGIDSNRAVEAECAVVESIDATAQAQAVFVAERAAFVDVAGNGLDAPISRDSLGIVDRVFAFLAKRRQGAALDQVIFIYCGRLLLLGRHWRDTLLRPSGLYRR